MSISSKLNLINNKWSFSKYKIEVTIQYENNDQKKLKDFQIVDLYIEKDYDNDHLPIVLLNISDNVVDLQRITSSSEFIIKIRQYNITEADGEKRDSKVYLSDRFTPILLDSSPCPEIKINKKIRDKSGAKKNDVLLEDLTQSKTFVLIRKRDFIMSKVMTNHVLRSANMLDVISVLVTESKCSKLLLSSLTNTKSYRELLLLPKPFLSQMLWVESTYGFHKEGTYIFIDMGILYIIRKNGKCTAFQTGEPTKINFCLSSQTGADSISRGIIRKNKEVYYNIGYNQYQLFDASIVEDQIEGNNMILIDQNTGFSSKIESGINAFDQNTYNVKSYHGHNNYVREQYIRKKMEANNQVKLTCSCGDLSFLTPNKQYGFLSDDVDIIPKFKGVYRLSKVVTSFIKNGDSFDTTSEILLKRVEKTITL